MSVWSKEVYHLRLRLQRPVERQPDPGRDRWQAGEEEEGLLWPTLRQALPRLRGRPEHARQGPKCASKWPISEGNPRFSGRF